MATFAAARSLLRTSSSAVRTSAPKFAAAPKPKSNPFSLPKQSPISSPRIFRSPVELSCCVESLMPYHTATASAFYAVGFFFFLAISAALCFSHGFIKHNLPPITSLSR